MKRLLLLVGIVSLLATGCYKILFPSNIGDFVTAGEGQTIAQPGNHDGMISWRENNALWLGMTMAQVEYIIGEDLYYRSVKTDGSEVYSWTHKNYCLMDNLYSLVWQTKYTFKDGKLVQNNFVPSYCDTTNPNYNPSLGGGGGGGGSW